MSRIYHPYMTSSLTERGLSFWIDTAEEQVVDGRTMVRHGRLLIDERDDWHETRTAAMDEAAVRIEAVAARLVAQAKAIREEAAAERAKAAEDDERYDRGLPPRIEATT